MATKRGKGLQAKALARRATKKAKRFSKRWDGRIALMEADFTARRIAEHAARIAAEAQQAPAVAQP